MKDLLLILAPPIWVNTPPLNLAYLKTYLNSKGINVDSLDLNLKVYRQLKLKPRNWLKIDLKFEKDLFSITRKHLPKIIPQVLEEIKNYRFIGLSLFKRNYAFSLNLIKKIKKYYPSKKIIVGGPEITNLGFDPTATFDFQIIGEGEKALEQIVNGSKKKTFKYLELDNLDRLDFLNFDDFPLPEYKNNLGLIASRGCISSCLFCSERNLYKNFRYHSPEYISDQIQFLKKKYQANTFTFQDSLINFNIPWLENLVKLFIKRKLNIKWQAQMLIRKGMDKNLLSLIKKSGCFNLFIGLESACDKVLKSMNKPFTKNLAQKMFTDLNEAKLFFEISLICGWPQETHQDFKETLSFIKENKNIIPKIAQINHFTPYPGSIIFNDQRSKQLDLKTLKQRVNLTIKMIKNNRIRHTENFINNLYEN